VSLWWTAAAAVLVSAGYLLWRFWRILLGRAGKADGPEMRLRKWNTYLLPALRRMLRGQMAVAAAGTFRSTADGIEHTIATWAMTPTLVPDVEYLALARPDGDSDAPDVTAVASAEALRGILGDAVRSQSLWGHAAWLYAWPPDADLDAVVGQLTPVDRFRRDHGLHSGAALVGTRSDTSNREGTG
jgi:hypothetical protein